jgi:MFS family permease
MGVLAMSTVMLAVFGHGQPDLAHVTLVCAIAGFFTNAGIVGLYGILAQVFPTNLRAGGTGFAVGTGRAGSVLAPIIAGFLFRDGYSLQFVAIAMGIGSLAGAVALGFVPFKRPSAS